MAGTTRTVTRQWSIQPNLSSGSNEDAQLVLFEEYNKVVIDLEVIRAGLAALAAAYNLALTKLDADAGVTDADYNSLHAVVATAYDAAADLTAATVATAESGD